MPRSNPLLWPKPPGIWSYWLAVFSVAAALIISRWPTLHLQDAPVSLFLCAVILSAWFGGIWPGLLATLLSAVTFYYFFLPPIDSFYAKPGEIPRLAIFMMSALFVGLLSVAQRSATESLRYAGDHLKGTVQELQNTNEALQAESRERKSAEESLRRSESYLAEAQRLTHTGSWAWQVAGRDALHLSEEWYRLYGCDPEKGPPAWEERLQRVHPEDRAKWQGAIDRAIAESSDYEVEFRILLPDGAVKYIHSVGHPVLNASGDLVEFVGSSTDITERKRAEVLLGGENRLLGMIARGDSLPLILDAICRLVEELASGSLSSILLMDPSANRLRHAAAPSLPSSYNEAVDGVVIGPSAGSCGTAAYRAAPVIVSDIATDPLWADYRDVALAHGLRACWSTPILSPAGKVLGTFAIYRREPRYPTALDHSVISQIVHLASIAIERKRAEESLRQAQADLAHVSRVTTMGELTASLAHEVNQPIAAAVTSANSCIRWLGADVPNLDKARTAAARIVKDGTRAAEIINRIRMLFQRGTLQKELVGVNEVIEEMIVLLRGEATRYSISVRRELAADLPPVMGDRVQLQQVMMNLMINSIDAMKAVEGTRELAIQSQRDENEQLLVSVSDTGVGLPAGQADQIFNAFFTTKPHGIGMGLRICRSIVESHGGRLWAADNSPRGASFYLTLPAKVEAGA